MLMGCKGGVAADEFLITVGCDSVTVRVTPSAMRESLKRVGGSGKDKRDMVGYWGNRGVAPIDKQ